MLDIRRLILIPFAEPIWATRSLVIIMQSLSLMQVYIVLCHQTISVSISTLGLFNDANILQSSYSQMLLFVAFLAFSFAGAPPLVQCTFCFSHRGINCAFGSKKNRVPSLRFSTCWTTATVPSETYSRVSINLLLVSIQALNDLHRSSYHLQPISSAWLCWNSHLLSFCVAVACNMWSLKGVKGEHGILFLKTNSNEGHSKLFFIALPERGIVSLSDCNRI